MIISFHIYKHILLIYKSKLLILAKNKFLEICKRLLQNLKFFILYYSLFYFIINYILNFFPGSHNLYGFAIKPNLIFYLYVEPKELLRRVFEKNMMLSYYESGEDVGLSDDILNLSCFISRKLNKNLLECKKVMELFQ